MQVFDINLKPTESRAVDVQASYIYFLDGSAGGADTTISVTPTGGGETVYLKPGQAYKLAGAAPTMGRWTISNLRGEGTIIGRVLMGEGEFSDNRVSGSVEVIDGGKARTNADLAGMGYVDIGPGTAMYSHVQLWNPASSGKNIFVEQVAFSSSGTVNNGIIMRGSVTPLANFVNNASRKRIGAPNSFGEMRVENGSGFLGAGNYLCALDKTLKLFKFTEPVALRPGNGLLLLNAMTNESLGGTFEFFEEPV